MMEIVTVYDGNSDGMVVVYRHYPYQIPSLFCRRESACKIPFCFLIIYDRNFTISSSTVLIPPIPNCSINTFFTFGERKAGRVGPR